MTQTPGPAPVAKVPNIPTPVPATPTPTPTPNPPSQASLPPLPTVKPNTAAQQKIQNYNSTPTPPPVPKPKGARSPEELEAGDLGPTESPIQTIPQALAPVNEYFKKISITSGLALAFFLLVALIWLLIPTASGYTRAQLLWFTIIGSTKLTTDKSPSQPPGGDTTTFVPGTNVPQPLTTPTTATPTLPKPNPGTGLTPSSGPGSNGFAEIDLSALDYAGF